MNDEILNWLSNQTPSELVEAYVTSFGVPHFEKVDAMAILLNLKETKDAIGNLEAVRATHDQFKEMYFS
jgi:hypothetical protein